jgi:transcriptional regulator with XRE-family HTH domain
MQTAGLGATIRIWRERLSPTAAGLPARHGRRAKGLRREELAELAGISVDYVIRLEQGRAATPSAQVVSSLARALQLTRAERNHLYRLASQAPPTDEEICDHISPGVHRVVSRLDRAAVAIFAADWRLIWWNRGWAALVGDPSSAPPPLRNFARDVFPIDSEDPVLCKWPVTSLHGDAVEAAIVSDLRRATGRFPNDNRLSGLIRALIAGNDRFAQLWNAGAVGAHRSDHKVIEHPSVGPISVDCDVLTDGEDDLKIVIMTAAPDSEDESKIQLATVAGVQEPSPPTRVENFR